MGWEGGGGGEGLMGREAQAEGINGEGGAGGSV